MTVEEEIRHWMHGREDELVEALAPLIAAESTRSEAKPGMPFGEGPAKALDRALELARRWGFRTENHEGYVGTADLNEHADGLHILAHLDVVGAGDGWDTDPYCLVRDGDLIYGRGTDDDKGPLVAALLAMRCVRELGIPLTKNVRLIMGTDEESGSEDIEHYYASHPFAPYSLSPDADFPVTNIEKAHYCPRFSASWKRTEAPGVHVLALDGGIRVNVAPANCTCLLENADKAQLEAVLKQVSGETGVSLSAEFRGNTAKITAVGVQAHASTPDEGKNAITATLQALCALPLAEGAAEETVRQLHECFPYGDNRGKAMGIAMEDKISGCLTLTFSMVHLDTEGFWGIFDSRDPLCATEENTCRVTEARMAAFGWKCEGKLGPAHAVDGNSDFIKTLLSAYETYTGRKGYCEAIGGGTYVHEIPGGVAFGAGEHDFDSHLHGANERARISQLLKTAMIYALVIGNLCA